MSLALLGVLAITGVGVGGARFVKARTRLISWNWYLAALALAALLALAIWAGAGLYVSLGSRRRPVDRERGLGRRQPDARARHGRRG